MSEHDEVIAGEEDETDARAVEEFEPVDLTADLELLDELLSLSEPALESFSEGATIGPLSLESFLSPGGDWGGSRRPCERAVHVGAANGLQVTSRKRSSGNTTSDHHVSQTRSYAVDLSNSTHPTPQMLRTARQIAAAMGYSWPANGYIQTGVTSHGYRAQLIYNSSVVPNHQNHVHFGVRKVR